MKKTQLELFTKNDTDKAPLMHLLELPKTAEVVSRVVAFGARKYTRNNWRKANNLEDKERYMSACLRHLTAYHNGQLVDPETGLHHLGHAITNLAFIIELEAEQFGAKDE